MANQEILTKEKVYDILFKTMQNKGLSFSVYDCSNKYHNNIQIEPTGYKDKKFDGMAILFEDGIYEVVEQQAGKKENELHIFLETRSLKVALNNLMKGNKRRKSEILKIWD